jgi:4-amino-4-deoxy-L-arabinose transferase-like glycosyltransferase
VSTTATGPARSASRDAAVEEPAPTRDGAQSTRRRRRVSWPVWGAVGALMVVSTVAHLWALEGFLPVPDIDEPFFVRPAVQIAATGDPNPGWFGHPGSTVIYPLAGLFHVWDAVAHHGPILTSNSELTARFQRSPSEFYVIGRLWTIALSVGALPLLFLVGRRAFNTRVALVATAIWAVLPLPVHLGRVVRTDSAAVFFGLLALWLCLRLLDEPRTRWCILAGVGVGLAVSSRYFMVALVPVLVAAAVLPHRRALGTAVRSAGIGLASAIGGFALSTPYFFLDWNTALDSLQRENASRPGATGLSHLGNLRWYLGTGIPASMTWPLVALAATGVVLIAWRRRPRQLLLVAFCAIFLAGICTSREHWIRWVIQILPVLVLFAAAAADTITRGVVAAIPRVPRPSIVAPVALGAVTVILVLHPLAVLNEVNHYDNGTISISGATRSAARDWIVGHVQPGSRIIGEPDTLPALGRRLDVSHRLNPRTRTLADYQNAGYQYLVINSLRAGLYRFDATHHPREAAFYGDVACHTRLVALLPRGALQLRDGWPIRIYQLDKPPRRISGYFCTQPIDD